MKRSLRIFLLLAFVFALFCAQAHAADPDPIRRPEPPEHPTVYPSAAKMEMVAAYGESGDWKIGMVNGEYVLSKYTGSETNVTVPSEVNGVPVTKLYYTFFDNENIVSVTLPSSVTALEHAFYGCKSLKSVTGGRITDLGKWSFGQCEAIETIPTLQEGLCTVSNNTFYYCKSLQSVTLPSTVSAIDEDAFYMCGSLRSVNLPSGLVSIGNYAFDWCQSLAELDIPDSVSSIGESAFWRSTRLIVGAGTFAQQYAVRNDCIYQIRGAVDLTVEIAPDATDVNTKANAIVATLVKPDMSDYEKALILHDYLILHASYDYTFSRYTAADILLYHSGVCQTYTEAYEELLIRAGIPCAREHGDNHVWNMARLGGDWVHIDCTWDDPTTSDGSDAECHDFFGLTNYALEGVCNHECYDKPHIATSVKQSYFCQSGMLGERKAELMSEVNALLNEGTLHGSASAGFYPTNYYDSQKAGICNRMLCQSVSNDGLEGAQCHGYPVSLETSCAAASMSFDAYVQVPATMTMTLPGMLTELESESLAGTAAQRFVLPASVKSIADDAFPDGFFVIEAPADSYALSFAQERTLPWQTKPAA